MSDTFDWADLLIDVICKRIEEGDPAAAAYLRTRIEAAFVPVEQRDKAEALLYQRTNEYIQATARAEAAEARNKVLEEALRVIDAYLYATAPDSNECQIVTAALGAEHGK